MRQAPFRPFDLQAHYEPAGDQPKAIKELLEGLDRKEQFQTLLGVTGSGKTFTMANVIAQHNKPTLVISHNKTLAAQLYAELKSFFPNNPVEFFISYYDYYQPEAYVVSSDTFIEKDFSINEEIDRLRLKATTALIEGRNDVIIVASVSCIYGIGAPHEYAEQTIFLHKGDILPKREFMRNLVKIYYSRNDLDFVRGSFRMRGDVVEIIPAYEIEEALRFEFFDDEIERISVIEPITGDVLREIEETAIYPAKYFVTNPERQKLSLALIEAELEQRLADFREQERYLEAQRIEQRTRFDMEMIKEVGYCSGIENYSRYMDLREPGTRPYCLLTISPMIFL